MDNNWLWGGSRPQWATSSWSAVWWTPGSCGSCYTWSWLSCPSALAAWICQQGTTWHISLNNSTDQMHTDTVISFSGMNEASCTRSSESFLIKGLITMSKTRFLLYYTCFTFCCWSCISGSWSLWNAIASGSRSFMMQTVLFFFFCC